MPAHNEEETIAPALQRLCALLDNEPYEYEVIVVDDGSLDTTSSMAFKELCRLAARMKARMVQNQEEPLVRILIQEMFQKLTEMR